LIDVFALVIQKYQNIKIVKATKLEGKCNLE